MKRILGILLAVMLAAGQNCENLSVPSSETSSTGQIDWNNGSSGGTDSTQASEFPIPEVGAPVSIEISSDGPVPADVLVRYLIGAMEVHRTAWHVPAGSSLRRIGPDLAAVIEVSGAYLGGGAIPSRVYRLGEDFSPGGLVLYYIPDPTDQCPADAAKKLAGQCGCGVPDVDMDGDAAADCNDHCPADAGKVNPGLCGCGTPDLDSDSDATPDCLDGCSGDPAKTAPGTCGCGVIDDADSDGLADCLQPPDADSDGVADASDNCVAQYNPTQFDDDADGLGNACDNCAKVANGNQADTDSDGLGNACDGCTDTDGDGFGNPRFANSCPLDNCPSIYNPDQADADTNGVGDACEPRIIVNWMSVRSHGSIPLAIWIDPYSGAGYPISVESRQGGIQRIEVTFIAPMTLKDSSGISVVGQTTVAGVPQPPLAYTPSAVFMRNVLTLVMQFTEGLPDETCYTFGIGPSTFLEPLTGSTEVKVRSLVGDVSGDGIVDGTDVYIINNAVSYLFGAEYAPGDDVNTSGGYIDAADASLVSSRVTTPAHEAVCPGTVIIAGSK